jgi:hypothetical protein
MRATRLFMRTSAVRMGMGGMGLCGCVVTGLMMLCSFAMAMCCGLMTRSCFVVLVGSGMILVTLLPCSYVLRVGSALSMTGIGHGRLLTE